MANKKGLRAMRPSRTTAIAPSSDFGVRAHIITENQTSCMCTPLAAGVRRRRINVNLVRARTGRRGGTKGSGGQKAREFHLH